MRFGRINPTGSRRRDLATEIVMGYMDSAGSMILFQPFVNSHLRSGVAGTRLYLPGSREISVVQTHLILRSS
jgi:hypothetical protein